MYLGCRKALKTGAQLVASAHEQGAANHVLQRIVALNLRLHFGCGARIVFSLSNC
jgi:hypothetical protein